MSSDQNARRHLFSSDAAKSGFLFLSLKKKIINGTTVEPECVRPKVGALENGRMFEERADLFTNTALTTWIS